VEFRDSDSGRQAYLVGSSLAVWEVVMTNQSYGHSAEQTAAHLRWPLTRIEPVLAYARTYQQAIAAALQENRSVSLPDLRRSLPNSHWT
jgi:uncharacterized protein (DUF433 family)